MKLSSFSSKIVCLTGLCICVLVVIFLIGGKRLRQVDKYKLTLKDKQSFVVKHDISLEKRFQIPKHNSSVSRKHVRIVTFNGSEFIKIPKICKSKNKFKKLSLKTPFGNRPIFVHRIEDDKWISANLKNYGKWEYRNVKNVFKFLQADSEIGFVDVGAHLGVFSLSVAKLGRRVISVDPLTQNVQRLCKSAKKGEFPDSITIVLNPLSDKHQPYYLKTTKGNISGTQVIEVGEEIATSKGKSLNQSKQKNSKSKHRKFGMNSTATLDDLLPLMTFRKAVLKIDVQNHEFHVVNGGQEFFKVIDVSAIFMEWELVKNDEDGQRLVDTLVGYNFKAVSPFKLSELLDVRDFKSWPVDVVWIKK